MIMSSITELPNELFNDIIDRVHNTSPESLAAVSLTCKRLQSFVRLLQWHNVSLPWRLKKTAPIARFIEAHLGNNAIRLFRLLPQIAVLNAFSVNMSSAFDHVEPLCRFLGSLPRIATFSTFMDAYLHPRCELPGPVLARVVRALPPSVTNLELDTDGVDRVWQRNAVADPADHLCLAISDCIPRLEFLWLGLSCVCTELFRSLQSSACSQPTSKLRRAFIRLDTSPDHDRSGYMPLPVSDCRLPRARPGAYRLLETHGALVPKKLFDHLLGLHAAGAFPSLERFILFSWALSADESKHYFRVRDVASRTLTRYPKLWADQLSNRNVYELLDKDKNSLFMIRDRDGTDHYGDRIDYERAIMHEVSWIATKNGTRSAPTVKLSNVEQQLCTSGLIPAECLLKQRQENLEQGHDGWGPFLPDTSVLAGRVLVDKF